VASNLLARLIDGATTAKAVLPVGALEMEQALSRSLRPVASQHTTVLDSVHEGARGSLQLVHAGSADRWPFDLKFEVSAMTPGVVLSAAP